MPLMTAIKFVSHETAQTRLTPSRPLCRRPPSPFPPLSRASLAPEFGSNTITTTSKNPIRYAKN